MTDVDKLILFAQDHPEHREAILNEAADLLDQSLEAVGLRWAAKESKFPRKGYFPRHENPYYEWTNDEPPFSQVDCKGSELPQRIYLGLEGYSIFNVIPSEAYGWSRRDEASCLRALFASLGRAIVANDWMFDAKGILSKVVPLDKSITSASLPRTSWEYYG